MTPTGTNLLGLVKHLAGLEYGYLGESLGNSSTGRAARIRTPSTNPPGGNTSPRFKLRPMRSSPGPMCNGLATSPSGHTPDQYSHPTGFDPRAFPAASRFAGPQRSSLIALHGATASQRAFRPVG